MSFLVVRAAEVPPGDAWLDDEERAVLATRFIPKRRDDWRLGRFTAKAAVGAALGVAPARVGVRAADDGAPYALVDGRSAPVSLSLSHREGHGLAAVGSTGLVGADVEWVEPRRDVFIEDWLAPAEQVAVHAAGPDRDRLVATLWAAKEAVAKVHHDGLRIDVRHTVVTLEAAGDREWARLTARSDNGRCDEGWWRVEGRLVLAVAADPPAPAPPNPLSGPTSTARPAAATAEVRRSGDRR